jgi:spermidine synthase
VPEILSYPIRGTKFSYSVEVSQHLLSRQSNFQKIDIYDTPCFGKILTLDGHVQLSSLDEFAYHEALIHIPMLSIPSPKRALVVGGGDGGALRELCRWKVLEEIDIVEIDAGVVEACREYLPELSDGGFDDPRVTLRIGDAFEFLRNVAEPYDFIVMDITDVYEEEDQALSENLMTGKFLADVREALTPNGLAVSQADNLLFCPYSIEGLTRSLGEVFPKVGSYYALVPSFGGFSGYCWAGKEIEVAKQWPGDPGLALKYLDAASYGLGMSPLPFSNEVTSHKLANS